MPPAVAHERAREKVGTPHTPARGLRPLHPPFEPPAAAGEERKRGHPTPRQGDCVPLLNSYKRRVAHEGDIDIINLQYRS